MNDEEKLNLIVNKYLANNLPKQIWDELENATIEEETFQSFINFCKYIKDPLSNFTSKKVNSEFSKFKKITLELFDFIKAHFFEYKFLYALYPDHRHKYDKQEFWHSHFEELNKLSDRFLKQYKKFITESSKIIHRIDYRDNIYISKEKGIWVDEEKEYRISRKRIKLVYLLKDGPKPGKILIDVQKQSKELLSKEIAVINKIFKSKIGIEYNLIVNYSMGYELNVDKLNIIFKD